MAISQVRAQFNGAWYTLTYNSATGKYETSITPTAISSGQTGGYYNVTVEAQSSGGASAAATGATMAGLRLVVEDKTAPTLTVTAPADGLVTAASSVTVTGKASDSGGLKSVTVNGAAVTVAADGSFSAVVSLSAGSGAITVTATDGAGNTTAITRTVTRVTAGPALTIQTPGGGAITNQSPITVTGTASDSVSPVKGVTVNGITATIIGDTYSASIPLTEGGNTITVTASNQAGLTTTKAVTVNLDTIPPTLTVTSPAGDLITNQTVLEIAGTASDTGSGLDSITVNGQAAELGENGGFSASVSLSEGTNTITVSATDRTGNTAAVTRTVIVDTQKPVLTLISPAEGWLKVNRPTVVFQAADEAGGSGLDRDSVTVTVDGADQTAGASISESGEISFTPVSSLSEGAHVITVTVKDRAGNDRGLSAAYGIDTIPPTLSILNPAFHHVVDRPQAEVTLRVSDDGSGVSRVEIGGTSVAPTTEGYTVLYKRTVPLEIGENRISLRVSDRAGWTAAEELYMIRLVTDRTQSDIDRLEDMYKRGMAKWTGDELAWFLSAGSLRGSYDAADLNRIGLALQHLKQELEARGFLPLTRDAAVGEIIPKTDWVIPASPLQAETELVLKDVKSVRDCQGLEELSVYPVPDSIRFPTLETANQIEKALAEVESTFHRYRAWTSGEISCGEG